MLNKLKKRLLIILFSIVILIVIIGLGKAIKKSVTENDEGIYFSTFFLVDKGYKLYKEIFFSQPPGFFLTTYPLFIAFGKTIVAARLSILFWVTIGLISLIWLIGTNGILTIFILLSIPNFYNQIVTFQSDALVVTFSLISLIFIWKFKEKLKIIYLIFSSLFFSLALWTKFDISLLIPITITLFSIRKRLTGYLLFITIFIIVSIFMIVTFELKEFFNNVLLLRVQAFGVYLWEPFKVFELVRTDFYLTAIMVITPILFFLKKPKMFSLEAITFSWAVFSFIPMFYYRPLFSHHLILLTVPFVLSFTLLLKNHNNIKKIALILFTGIVLINAMFGLMGKNKFNLTNEQLVGIQVVNKYTQPNDLIISDEAILQGLSGRLPPPELTDVSYVRIKSGNLTPEKFDQIISKYRPRLILSWNGKLKSMKNFEKIMEKNKYQIIFKENSKEAFLLTDK